MRSTQIEIGIHVFLFLSESYIHKKQPPEDNTQNYTQSWKVIDNNILKIIFRIILFCAKKNIGRFCYTKRLTSTRRLIVMQGDFVETGDIKP